MTRATDPPTTRVMTYRYNDDFKVSSEEYADDAGEVDEEGNRLCSRTRTQMVVFSPTGVPMIYSRRDVGEKIC